MNIFPKHSNTYLFRALLLATLFCTLSATAQTFNLLHSFADPAAGAYPHGTLLLSNGVLYGTTGSGGTGANGTIFRMNSDGSGFTNLHYFSVSGGSGTNAEGAGPLAGLILSGSTLYGTAASGGTFGGGTVFRMNTDGTGFTNLHNFIFSDGKNPNGGLALIGNTLYGTTSFGGADFANAGTLFAVNTDGTGYTNLHVFTTLSSDGGNPYAGMIASGNVLYGTTIGGGAAGYGVIFSINADGTGYTTLHSFPGANNEPQTEGIYSYAPLVLAGNTLYGTAYQGGDSGEGLVFSIATSGANYTKLYSFTSLSSATNDDGALPNTGVVLNGDTLYGTTIRGGSSGYGTVFAVKTNGTAFTNMHSLAIGDGIYPYAGLASGDNALYGMTSMGDSSNPYGSIFRLALSTVVVPKLIIASTGTNVVLSWPTNATGFTLQFSTNLTAPIVWTTNASTPIILNGYYVVTNASGPQKFYRLSTALP